VGKQLGSLPLRQAFKEIYIFFSFIKSAARAAAGKASITDLQEWSKLYFIEC